jgi:hypothetical protein
MVIVCHTYGATIAVLVAVLASGVDSVNGFYISKSHPEGFPDRYTVAPDIPADVCARLLDRLRLIADITIENAVVV